jgi:hypothetical protein
MRRAKPNTPSFHRPGGGPAPAPTGTHGLARVLSRLGLVSRSEAWRWIADGRVTVDGAVVRDPERRTDPRRERIAVDGAPIRAAKKLYYVMNKPVGVVTTARDPQGRRTVYDVLREALGGSADRGQGTENRGPGTGNRRRKEAAPSPGSFRSAGSMR